MSQSELAQKAGISRQLVSVWFKKAETQTDLNINVYSNTQENLALVLGVSVKDLSLLLPIVSNQKQKSEFETTLLWDSLYPSIESFTAGFIRGQPEALARLVQTYGLFHSEKIAGKQV